MAVTIIDIISQLQSLGNKITYIKRKDGGYRITSINGIKYKGSSGNTVARGMAGATISKAREVQLERIQKANRRVKGKIKKKSPLPDDIKKQLHRIQRKWRREHETSEGFITTAKVRWLIEHYGLDEARKSLNNMERYASGLAYEANVLALAERIQKFLNSWYDIELDKTRNNIIAKKNEFKEKWIEPINRIMYELDKLARAGSLTHDDVRQASRNINRIIGA